MAITINGTGSITGLSAGGLPDGSITASDLASSLDLTGKTVTLPAGTGGKVLQVVQAWKSDYSTISTNINVGYASYPTIFSGSITPSSTSSKILILYFISGSTDAYVHMVSTIKRAISGGATSYPALGDSASGFYQATTGTRGIDANNYNIANQSAQYLDSPNTTSAITYSIIGASESGNTWEINSNGENYSGQSWSTRFASGMIMMEIGA
jgi:hypothetical protein